MRLRVPPTLPRPGRPLMPRSRVRPALSCCRAAVRWSDRPSGRGMLCGAACALLVCLFPAVSTGEGRGAAAEGSEPVLAVVGGTLVHLDPRSLRPKGPRASVVDYISSAAYSPDRSRLARATQRSIRRPARLLVVSPRGAIRSVILDEIPASSEPSPSGQHGRQRDWSKRSLTEDASDFTVTGRTILAYESSEASDSTGSGVTAFGLDGDRLWHTLGSRRVEDVHVAGRRAFVWIADSSTTIVGQPVTIGVVDLRTGNGLRRFRRVWPEFISPS